MEDGDTIAILLQYVYPMSNPHVTTLLSLRPALIAAQKYEITSAIGGLRATLVSQVFLESDPLGVYAIACELGLKDEARAGKPLAFQVVFLYLQWSFFSKPRNTCF